MAVRTLASGAAMSIVLSMVNMVVVLSQGRRMSRSIPDNDLQDAENSRFRLATTEKTSAQGGTPLRCRTRPLLSGGKDQEERGFHVEPRWRSARAAGIASRTCDACPRVLDPKRGSQGLHQRRPPPHEEAP